MPSTDPERQPRRQARGERRMAQILAAATEVFAEVGSEAATTNAIAARAGISPGSLYQFFANKDAIVRALAEGYAQELAAVHAAAFAADDLLALPLDVVVARVLGPLVQFARERRAFKTLFEGTSGSPAMTAATAGLREPIVRRLGALFAAWAPHLSPDDLERTATVAYLLVKALLPTIADSPPADSARYERELCAVLFRYLEPVLAPPS